MRGLSPTKLRARACKSEVGQPRRSVLLSSGDIFTGLGHFKSPAIAVSSRIGGPAVAAMTTPPSDSGLTGLAPGATTRGSTADGDKVVHDLSEQLTHVRVQDSRRADGGAEAEAGVARSVIGAGTPPAGVAQPEVDSVDEGSAPIHEPTQSDQLSSTPAQPSQSVSPPSTTGPNPVASSAPTTLSGPSLDQPQPARSTIHSVPDTQDGVVEDQLVSDEWLLKTIHWPPLPAPPSDATGYSHSGPPIKVGTTRPSDCGFP